MPFGDPSIPDGIHLREIYNVCQPNSRVQYLSRNACGQKQVVDASETIGRLLGNIVPVPNLTAKIDETFTILLIRFPV